MARRAIRWVGLVSIPLAVTVSCARTVMRPRPQIPSELRGFSISSIELQAIPSSAVIITWDPPPGTHVELQSISYPVARDISTSRHRQEWVNREAQRFLSRQRDSGAPIEIVRAQPAPLRRGGRVVPGFAYVVRWDSRFAFTYLYVIEDQFLWIQGRVPVAEATTIEVQTLAEELAATIAGLERGSN